MPRFWNICERTLASNALEITARFPEIEEIAPWMAVSPPARTSDTAVIAR